MLEANAATIVPCPLRTREMAEVLAAHFAEESEVASLVERLAPRTASRLLAELSALVAGAVDPGELSPALRWILPEIHEELGHRFPALVA